MGRCLELGGRWRSWDRGKGMMGERRGRKIRGWG
jgi:hypothetical protein